MSLNRWPRSLRTAITANRPQRHTGATPPRFRPRLEAMEERAVPATFTVFNTLDNGVGSFRDALIQVNADTLSGIDTINFAIGSGVQTIAPWSALPTITHPVVIDGTTQPGFAGTPLIELNGAAAGYMPDGRAADGLTIDAGGSTVRALVVNRFGSGIVLRSAGGDILEGNYIGTDVTGTLRLGNHDGVVIYSAGNTIGGTTPGAGNLISGNLGNGIGIWDAVAGVPTSGNDLVQGNFIGTDATGTRGLGNGSGTSGSSAGIYVRGGLGFNVIGGTAEGARNLISGNYCGVWITNGGVVPGMSNTANSGNVLAGNFIGTDLTGTLDLGNSYGVQLVTNSNTVGGTAAAARNIISGGTWGILVARGTTGNLVQGDYIGTDISGTRALGNTYAVEVGNSPLTGPSNLIGGTAPGAGNLISGNGVGVYINDVASSAAHTGAVVQGNSIGTDVTGTRALANATGVWVYRTDVATIGGTVPGAGNTIAFNTSYGVRGSGVSVAVLQNLIFANGHQGIEPGAVPPVLTSAVGSSGSLTIAGTLTRTANSTYRLEFFSNPAGTAQGKTYLGFVTVTTDAKGKASFRVTFAVTVAAGEVITATVTDPFNRTSSFSAGRAVT